MDGCQRALLARIERAQLDFGAGEHGFAARLMRENRWSRSYAQRAIAEYRRFAFLSVVAGHVVVPSDQVDQVWHLHLLHTRAYWDDFCGQVLRQPLHHAPSQGSAAEGVRFRALYRQTLASYRAWFGADPPADVWPACERRFGTDFVRVERVTRARWRGRWRWRYAGLALCSVVLAACAQVHAVPPFQLPGPSFLVFYAIALAASFAGLALWRWLAGMNGPAQREHERALSDYEIAYLAGGPNAAVDAAIATLVEDGRLRIDVATKRLRTGAVYAADLDPLERSLLQSGRDPEGASASELRTRAAGETAPLAARLEALGLLFPRRLTRTWRVLTWVVPAIGVVKLSLGLAFDKPIGWLFALTVFALIAASRMFGSLHRRTPAGVTRLAGLREVATARQLGGDPLGPLPVAMAVGLFGAGVLADRALAETLDRRDWSGGGGGDGGGCGGGDGGGCGGGGCGGCGG